MRTLRFIARAACAIPHPDKADRGGEDGFFLSPDGRSLGVADGVGGWADAGVNPAFFTWTFMRRCMHYTSVTTPQALPLRDVLQAAWADTVRSKLQGSCTAAVVAFDEGRGIALGNEKDSLTVSLIGDCGVIVVRDGAVILRTKERQYKFNFPHQIGSDGSQSPNKLAGTDVIVVQPNDVVVLGSDGLFDNVFDADIVSMVVKALKASDCAISTAALKTVPCRIDCQSLADSIAHAASTRGADESYMSPFSTAAVKAGYRYLGGKLDDVCVVVGVVGEDVKGVAHAAPAYSDVESYFKWSGKPCAEMPPVNIGGAKL